MAYIQVCLCVCLYVYVWVGVVPATERFWDLPEYPRLIANGIKCSVVIETDRCYLREAS